MSEFWDWAVEAYGRGGVAEACLALQDDHGQCVPLLLWAAWRGMTGARIGDDAGTRAVALSRAWSEGVIAPLRAARRRLKTPLSEGDENDRLPLREHIKAIELEAEQALMRQLESLPGERRDVPPPFRPALVLDGLRRTAQLWSPDFPAEGVARLAEALTKGENLRYNA